MPKSHQLFLALGTNLGDRWDNLRQAVRALAALMVVETISPVYETAPWGIAAQPEFLNICLSGCTALAPHPLLASIKDLEVRLGRRPGLRWGPRLIDIDILFYDDLILRSEGLTIPHPHLAERAFVLAPLADIAPQFRHPQTGLSVAQMAAAVDMTSVHKLDEPLFEEER
jgi:2-amino-4-hydroxy-6-hydroxymethyldihydropteridine diphosphokinase